MSIRITVSVDDARLIAAACGDRAYALGAFEPSGARNMRPATERAQGERMRELQHEIAKVTRQQLAEREPKPTPAGEVWRIRLSDEAGTVPAWKFDSREAAEREIEHRLSTLPPRHGDPRWKNPTAYQEA